MSLADRLLFHPRAPEEEERHRLRAEIVGKMVPLPEEFFPLGTPLTHLIGQISPSDSEEASLIGYSFRNIRTDWFDDHLVLNLRLNTQQQEMVRQIVSSFAHPWKTDGTKIEGTVTIGDAREVLSTSGCILLLKGFEDPLNIEIASKLFGSTS